MSVKPLRLFRVLWLAAFVALLTTYVTAAASPIRQLTNTSAANLRPAWSPDGSRIAFQSNRDGAYHIYAMDPDGANVRQMSSGDNDDRHPAWSPDGKYIAVDSGSTQKREVWVIEVGNLSRTQVTNLGAIASFPSWSPDGRMLSFYVYQAGAMDLWTVRPDGAAPTRLTRSLASEESNQCTFACHAASWSPDSRRIAIADGDGARVVLLSATGGAASAPVSPADERSHFPIFLSDGQLVYVSEHITIDQSWTDLWSIGANLEGAARREVATNVQAQGPFELSGDGRQLLFASPRTGNFEIYAVTLDAAGKAALATKPERINPADVTAPAPAQRSGFALPTTAEPYLLALGLLALLGVGVESLMRSRRRAKTPG